MRSREYRWPDEETKAVPFCPPYAVAEGRRFGTGIPDPASEEAAFSSRSRFGVEMQGGGSHKQGR